MLLTLGPNKPAESDPRLFCQLLDNRRLPESVRNFFRFGVPTMEDWQNRKVGKERGDNIASEMQSKLEVDYLPENVGLTDDTIN